MGRFRFCFSARRTMNAGQFTFSRGFPNLRQALFQAVSEFVSAKSIFAPLRRSLKCKAAAPMWRNGRRNGLKIRSREQRRMGSTPIIGTIEILTVLGNSLGFAIFVDCEQSRTDTHENTVHSPSIRQVNSMNPKSTLEARPRSKNFQTVESTVNDSFARARYASTFSIRSDIGAIYKCTEIARRLSGGLALWVPRGASLLGTHNSFCVFTDGARPYREFLECLEHVDRIATSGSESEIRKCTFDGISSRSLNCGY